MTGQFLTACRADPGRVVGWPGRVRLRRRPGTRSRRVGEVGSEPTTPVPVAVGPVDIRCVVMRLPSWMRQARALEAGAYVPRNTSRVEATNWAPPLRDERRRLVRSRACAIRANSLRMRRSRNAGGGRSFLRGTAITRSNRARSGPVDSPARYSRTSVANAIGQARSRPGRTGHRARTTACRSGARPPRAWLPTELSSGPVSCTSWTRAPARLRSRPRSWSTSPASPLSSAGPV